MARFNKNKILELTNGGLDVYESYVGELTPNGEGKRKNISSPFRRDINPSFNIYLGDDDKWRFMDFGDDTYQGDVFDFVAFIENLEIDTDFNEILLKIIEAVNLDKNKVSIKDPIWDSLRNGKMSKEVEAVFYGYFIEYGITKETLNKFYAACVPLEVTDELKEYYKCNNPFIFGVKYHMGSCFKLYLPSPKTFRYVEGDKSKHFIFGVEQILKRNFSCYKGRIDNDRKSILIITAGEKDVMVLDSLGYDAVCLASESITNIPNNVIEIMEDYKRCIVLYDIDETGQRQSLKLCDKYPQLKRVILPKELIVNGGKDVADYVKLKMDIPKLKMLIEGEDDNNDGSDSDDNDNTPCIDADVYSNLPDTLREICEQFESPRDKDIVLLSMLGSMSNLFFKFKGIYHNAEVGTNLYIIIIAPPASGKGNVVWSRKIVASIEEQLHIENIKAMQVYQQNLENKNGKYIDPLPQRHLCIPGNSSSSSVIMVLQANQVFGLIHETEADTLANTTTKEWGDATDLYRKAFHHEPVTMGRVNKQYYISKPRLSIVLSGTGNQLKNLINSVENGLFSRFLCYTFNTALTWKNPFKSTDNNLEKFIEEQGKKLLGWWNLQDELEEDVFVYLTDEQQEQVNEYFSEKLEILTDNLGIEAAANVYRFGLIHFRICMILTVVRAFDNEDDFTKRLYVNDTAFEIAIKIMDCAFIHLEKVFSELTYNKQKGKLAKQHRDFYAALPNEYTTSEYKEIAKTLLGYSDDGAYNAHKNLIKLGLVESIAHGRFRKVK